MNAPGSSFTAPPSGLPLLVDARPATAALDTGIGVYSHHLLLALARRWQGSVTCLQAHGAAPLGTTTPIRLAPPVFDMGSGVDSIRTLATLFGFKAWLSTYYPAPGGRRVAGVQVIHDLIPLRRREEYRGLPLHDFCDRDLRRAAFEAAAVVADSEHTRRDIIDFFGIPEARVTVVYPGCDHESVEAPDAAPGELVATLAGRPFVLTVSTSVPRKNLYRLVAAHRLAFRRRPSDRPALVIAAADCDTATREALHRAGAGDVLVGTRLSRAELTWLYRHAALFVFPSLDEGFGLPVVEAMRHGVAVACSNRSCLPEVTGGAATLFDPEAVDDMAGAISGLLEDSDRCRELIRLGRRRADSFTWAAAARGVSAVLAGVLGARHHAEGVQ